MVKAELDLFRAVLDRADHGLAANLQRLGWCATQARGTSPSTTGTPWRLSAEIEACRADRATPPAGIPRRSPHHLRLLSGFAMDDMTRDMGWRLPASIGRRLERLDNLASTLARFLRRHRPRRSAASWRQALLELCDSIITYRTRYAPSPSCCRRSTCLA